MLTENHPLTAQGYNNVAFNLNAQRRFAEAQPLYEKGLEINRRVLTDLHPATAQSYNNVAFNLQALGKYDQAQPLFEKALELRRRLLTDDHIHTGQSLANLAQNFAAQGQYLEARDRWLSAVHSLDKARLRLAFTGMERVRDRSLARPALAAVQARPAGRGSEHGNRSRGA